MLFRVFNWNRLSDTGGSILLGLTPEQLAHGDPFYFDLDIATLFDSTSRKKNVFLQLKDFILKLVSILSILFDLFSNLT